MVRESQAALDKSVGMHYYITDCEGIGGRIKANPGDFIVEEVLLDGQVVPTTIAGKPIPRLNQRPGPWLWLIIEKRGVDSITLSLLIAKKLGLSPGDISFGGLKDAAAITSQIISVRGSRPEDIESLNLGDRVRVIHHYVMDSPFTTRDIWGNEFTVTIRDTQGAGLDECLEELRRGFPAYYGYQRFGLRRPNSHIVGKYIVMGRFEDAVMELLAHPYPTEPPGIRRVRELASVGKFAEALEALPRGLRYAPERIILRSLVEVPGDYLRALRKLPRELLSLYTEAYQSYLFNRFLSERLRRGLPIDKALPGDRVIMLDEHGLPTRHVIYVSDSMVDRVNEAIMRGRFAVVGTLPGYSTRTLPGVQGEIEQEIMSEEDVEPSDFRTGAFDWLRIRGSYRTMSVKPLIISTENHGDHVVLRFRLPRGNYATVFLREIMKPTRPEETLT
jgi:tRNA pseudouridine13 synthase